MDGGVEFDDLRLDGVSRREWEGVRGRRIGAVFQDPTSFLNPSLSVGSQLVEVLRVKGGFGRAAARSRALETANREVAQRIDQAIATIRGVLEPGG